MPEIGKPIGTKVPFVKHQRTHKMEKCTYTVKVGNPSSGSLSSLKTREFTGERNSMAVVHIGRHTPQSLTNWN